MIAIIFWTAKLFEKEKIEGIQAHNWPCHYVHNFRFGNLLAIGESFGYGIPLAISGALILIAIPFVM